MSQQSTQTTGMGFTGVLTIAFIILKLMGYINWSWWYVLMPLYIVPVVVIVCLVIYFVIDLTISFWSTNPKRKSRKY